MKREHSIGASVSETNAETAIDAVTVKANSRNSRPIIPPISSSGMNTAISETLIDKTVKPISREPLRAASWGGTPFSMWRGEVVHQAVGGPDKDPRAHDERSDHGEDAQ